MSILIRHFNILSIRYVRLLVACKSKSTSRAMSTIRDKFEKLPELAKPSHYTITLAPDLSKFTFDGQETVDIEILKPTNNLRLHASEINVKNASLILADGSELKNLEVQYDKKWTTITLDLRKEVSPQKARVCLDFVGELNDKMRGFYRSSYKDAAGNERFIASTQFESTYARLSFPCWDEPIYKAKFDISLIVDSNLTALSNMNAISETTTNGKKTVKYATTPLMSTYLVAFAVGDLEYIEDQTKSGCRMRLYTVPGKKEQGRFALELGTKAIDWYNEWFGIVCPLPKIDLLAVPDFSMGAMENWGLATYREVAVLVDEAKSSTRQKSRVALVVAHELAHFWFGDLVTMKWWTDLWLKEGFASFMEYMFVGANYPEFKIWLHFVNDELAQGFSLDALKSSHPIEVEIDNPNELDEIYDSITYAKSNSINRMLCSYLGEETFQKGLRIYLDRFKYGNAVTADLWDAHSEASGQDVKTLMSSWTKQMGFPLVSVTQRVDGDKRILKLSQTRFVADGSKDDQNLLWQVPITISTSADPKAIKQKMLLKDREQEFAIEGVKPDEWIKLNAGTTGFYRVDYPSDMFKALIPDISSKRLPVVDRFGITDDLFALVKAGRTSADQFLSLLAASVNEDEYTVWGALDAGLSSLINVINRATDPTLRSRFDKFIVKTLTPVGNRLGWDKQAGEDSQVPMLRALILGRLARCGDEATIKIAREKFEEHFEKKTELHPDLRLTIYGVIGRCDGESGANKLKKIFETVDFGEVERHCIIAMSQTPEETLLKSFFKYAIEEGKVRSQDLMLMFYGARATKIGQDFIWSYFKDHTKILLGKFGGVNSSLFQHCFKASSDGQCSSMIAADVENYVRTYLDADSAKTLDRTTRQITESIRLNEQLLKRNESILKEYLTKNGF
uniref:Aminopeptidase n=1 Tax=Ascaris suum TaxID=6253 RepID=F1KUM7_ASCSU